MKKLIITMETYVEDNKVEKYTENIDRLIVSRLMDIDKKQFKKVTEYDGTTKIDLGEI